MEMGVRKEDKKVEKSHGERREGIFPGKTGCPVGIKICKAY
jgi:hypothetical protein